VNVRYENKPKVEPRSAVLPAPTHSSVYIERMVDRAISPTKRQIMATETLKERKTSIVAKHKVVSQKDWLAARKELLKKEKAATHTRDALSAERRKLPWVRVEKNYIFDTPAGKRTLADLFNGHSQLVIYHFMFGPDWEEGCPSCSFLSD